ncbi:MAG: hypothetical protein GYB67_19340 [Chloroflexi bacterium]|nr:hypothetical protein [Chloroflexota bacterium]
MITFRWQVDPETALDAGQAAWMDDINQQLRLIAQTRADAIAAWMQANAPWQDVTGAARARLHTDVELLVEGLVIALDHGVDYGLFLELMGAGEFAIIGPALDTWAPIVYDDLRRLLQ